MGRHPATHVTRARDGPLGPRWAPQTHHPGVVHQCYHRGRDGILPCTALLILLSTAILALKFSSLTRSPCCSSRPFLSAFNALLFLIIGIPTYQASDTKELLTFDLRQTLPFF
jgi:hypothetical protein